MGELSLRHEREVDDLEDELQLRHLQTESTVWTTAPVKHTKTWSKNCTCEFATTPKTLGPADRQGNTARMPTQCEVRQNRQKPAMPLVSTTSEAPANRQSKGTQHVAYRDERNQPAHTTAHVDDERGRNKRTTDEPKLSFWSTPATMRSIWACQRPKGKRHSVANMNVRSHVHQENDERMDLRAEAAQ